MERIQINNLILVRRNALRLYMALVVILGISGCDKTPPYTDAMLDSGKLFDPSLYHPEKYLTSIAHPNPTSAEKARPVIIACHGYSATTFEWDEFRTWLKPDSNQVFVSQVLLGGHGRSYEEFKQSTWRDWQDSIKSEYERLVKEGYTNINFAGSSTSGPLIMELVASGYFNGKVTPKNILLVDPIVIASNKTLSLVGILGPMLGYIDTGNSAAEDKYWYHFRPQETLQELQTLLNRVRKDLEKGVTLPAGCAMKVYKSKKDDVADPVSAVMIYKGMRTASGGLIDMDMVDSRLHVFTRLDLRTDATDKDWMNQQKTFQDMENRVLNIMLE